MTTVTEAGEPTALPAGPLDEHWRAAAAAQQERVLPRGSVLVSAPAPFGVGGVGRHLGEIWGALERSGQEAACICESEHPSALPMPPRSAQARLRSVVMTPISRFSPAWRKWSVSVDFDSRAARAIRPAEHLIAFNGTAIAQFTAARRDGFRSLSLVAANSHFEKVVRQHARAHSQYPIEGSWPARLLARNLAEYRQADRIYFATDYIRDSFLEAGVKESSLSHFPLTPDRRFVPAAARSRSSKFAVVYVGSLSVHKGVPLLIDAVRALPYSDLQLLLVGGWGTRGMRRFIERSCLEDPRISVTRGDPLPHLQAARLCVHAAYEDGFAYAPAEALACGVPLIVSEDTGMKELIDGARGRIVPTGDLTALTEAIDDAYRAGGA
jgi:glycosyltransferase involved in cell wall biosynthesis